MCSIKNKDAPSNKCEYLTTKKWLLPSILKKAILTNCTINVKLNTVANNVRFAVVPYKSIMFFMKNPKTKQFIYDPTKKRYNSINNIVKIITYTMLKLYFKVVSLINISKGRIQ